MITSTLDQQAGFSAVELLITLFIAAAFIATGTQLYSVVIQNSDEARMRARASNIAYENVRKYAGTASGPCVVTSPSPQPTIAASAGLPNATITVSITCPYGAGQATSKVESKVLYGASSPQQETVHAIYVTD